MFILKQSLWIVFVGVLLMGAPAMTSAQCTTTYQSLEGQICVAGSVYYGSISDWKRTVIVPRNGTREGSSTTIPDGVVRYVLTINVIEFLKGPKCNVAELVTETSDYDKRFEQWTEQKSTFLFFVHDQDQAEGKEPVSDLWPPPWTYLRLEKPAPAEKSYMTPTPPLFSKEGTVLQKPDEILMRARRFGKAHPKNLKAHTFTIPRATAELCSPSCDVNFLVVPIEPGLENTAKRMLASPENLVANQGMLDEISRNTLRLAGVDGLRYFKSAENEKLLHSLLNDPASYLIDSDFGPSKGKRVREYPIRKEAWAILKSWGRNVPKPVMKEILDGENDR